jgi:hypothetical protein
MQTPFRLDDHPRRPQPLAPPPDVYFDQLPMRVMQRVRPHTTTSGGAGPRWLAALSVPLRTALAATVVLGGFVGSFLLSQPGTFPTTGAASATALAAVPRTEMVDYLLASEQRLTLPDLAELPATEQALPDSFLRASPGELQDLLDAQPTEDSYL